jgi:S1-C subfamily serine protease
MKTRLLALGVALAGAARASVILPDHDSRWKAVADRLFSTVIEVRGQEAQETVSSGSGVLIGNGLAITTLHAVAVPGPDGRLVPLREVRVLVADVGPMDARVIAGVPEIDLALLLLPDRGASLAGAPLAAEVPAEGDLLVAMGAGDDAVTVRGVVVSSVNGDFFALSGKRMIDSRFWGGPLFDGEGRLVGILLTSLAGPKAISARVMQRLLDQRGVTLGSPAPP